MKPEPLKGKTRYYLDAISIHHDKDIKSAIEGLIKFHEDRIEKLIKDCKTMDDDILFLSHYIEYIDKEYESIMAIEKWMEDVI